jgi:hypothetical protein
MLEMHDATEMKQEQTHDINRYTLFIIDSYITPTTIYSILFSQIILL